MHRLSDRDGIIQVIVGELDRGPLMEWSGRAPAPPASKAGKGRRRRGARHVSEHYHRGDRHRYRQKLIPRGGSRSAWRDHVAPEVARKPARMTAGDVTVMGAAGHLSAQDRSRHAQEAIFDIIQTRHAGSLRATVRPQGGQHGQHDASDHHHPRGDPSRWRLVRPGTLVLGRSSGTCYRARG
jgi:hypothetical protein